MGAMLVSLWLDEGGESCVPDPVQHGSKVDEPARHGDAGDVVISPTAGSSNSAKIAGNVTCLALQCPQAEMRAQPRRKPLISLSLKGSQ